MSDHDHLVQAGIVYLLDRRSHAVGNGDGGEVSRRRAVSRHIDRQHRQFGCQAAQLVDGEIPAIRGMLTAVNENQRGEEQF
jgi:hypothetical protein